MFVGDATRRVVRVWVAGRIAAGTSGRTVCNDLVVASSAWKWAEDEELTDSENPFPRARPKRFSEKTRRALEPSELLALTDAVREEVPALYPIFLAALFSGWRGGELCGLKEKALHLAAERPHMTVTADQEKTGKEKTAFLGEPLVSLLRAERQAVKRLPEAFAFTDEKGRPWTRKSRLRRLRKALAAVPEEVIPAEKREASDTHIALDWHSLRHSVRTLLSSRGHRDAAVGELLGQANVATQRRYDHGYATEAQTIAADMTRFLEDEQAEAAEK